MKISRPKKLQHDRDMFECRHTSMLVNGTRVAYEAGDPITLTLWFAQLESPRLDTRGVEVKVEVTKDEARKLAARLLEGVERIEKIEKGEN